MEERDLDPDFAPFFPRTSLAFAGHVVVGGG